MNVVYRLCDIRSTNPSPIYDDNKWELNLLCLRSFVRAFKDVKPYIYFILDHCPSTYIDMLKKEVPFKFDFEMTFEGRGGSMNKAYSIAKDIDDIVLFQECDYFWLPNTGRILEDAVKELGLVVPYDNLNFYLDPSIHSEDVKLRLVKGRHWRSVERATMTFAMKPEILKENYYTLLKYADQDNDVWHELRAKGHQLWSPVPSLATHMVSDFIAPSVDWKYEI